MIHLVFPAKQGKAIPFLRYSGIEAEHHLHTEVNLMRYRAVDFVISNVGKIDSEGMINWTSFAEDGWTDEWERAKSLSFISLSSIQVENLIDFRQKCVQISSRECRYIGCHRWSLDDYSINVVQILHEWRIIFNEFYFLLLHLFQLDFLLSAAFKTMWT